MKPALLLVAALPVALVAAAPAAPAPEPEQGRYVVLEPVSGDVEVRPASSTRYRDLDARRRYPVGVTVDAQEGAVRLIVGRGDDGGVSRAVFSDGKFTVTQAREGDPVATLRLTGPSYADVCDGATAAAKREARPQAVGRRQGLVPHLRPLLRGHGAGHEVADRGPLRRHDHARRARRGPGRRLRRGAAGPATPTPEPGEPSPPAGPVQGGGEGGGEPAVRPVTDGSGGDVIVSAGGSYAARP